MEEYKRKFRTHCAETIMTMINDERIDHVMFMRTVITLSKLNERYLSKLRQFHSNVTRQTLLDNYIILVSKVYAGIVDHQYFKNNNNNG